MALNIEDMDEKQFRQELVMPILKQMGFIDVADTQGPNEFGLDVRFAEYDRFGTKRWYGAQLKVGDMSGKVDGKVNEIVAQVETAFKVSFKDLTSKQDTFVSEMYVIVSGRFKDNAKAILLGRLAQHINWIHFLDGDQLLNLRRRHYQDIASALHCLLSEIEGNIGFTQIVSAHRDFSTYLFYSYALDHLKEALKILTPLPEFSGLVDDLERLRVGLTKCNRSLEIIPILISIRGAAPEYAYLRKQAEALDQMLPNLRDQVQQVLGRLGP